MLAQAAGLALLSALSPTALLIAAVYLGSARPGLTSFFYLAGAVLMSIVMGVVVLIALRSAGLNHPDQHGPVTAFGLASVSCSSRRPPSSRPASPGRPIPRSAQHGLVSRMVADPAPLSAFVVGLLVFAPGVTFIAALQVIATARAGPKVTALALLLVVVINVLLVWLPITLHLVAPHSTEKRLKAFNSWLRANGRTVLTGVLVVAGGIMVSDGIYGLITRPG